jgi:hypothetical protein
LAESPVPSVTSVAASTWTPGFGSSAKIAAAERDVVLVPLTRLSFVALDFRYTRELADHFGLGGYRPGGVALELKSVEAVDVAGAATLELRLDALGQGPRFAGNPQQHAAVAGRFAGRPPPLDDEPEVGELLLRGEVSHRLAPADEQPVADAPHVFHFHIRFDEIVLPTGETLAVEQVDAAFQLLRRRGQPTGRKHGHNRHQTSATSHDTSPFLFCGLLNSTQRVPELCSRVPA